MKPLDVVQQYIEDNKRLSQRFEALSRPDPNSVVLANLASVEKFAYIDLAKQLADTSLFEAARVMSGQFEAVKASILATGVDLAQTFHKLDLSPATLNALQETSERYARHFRAISGGDMHRAIEIAANIAPNWAGIAGVDPEFLRQLAATTSPLIRIADSLKSLRGLNELAAIGAAVRLAEPFDTDFAQNLRLDLGDWRDVGVDVGGLLEDPVGRVSLYEEWGFNPELTNFPAASFESALAISRIDLGPVGETLAPPPMNMVPAFNVQAYQWLFVLERELRAFILKCLKVVSGDNWESRLPADMRAKWHERKTKALAEGEAEQPLIHYADFVDYNDILLGKANWRDCFKDTFKREEAVREGFNRLRPIRLITAHMRVMTHEEWVLLNVEVRRLLRAIGVST